MKDVVGSDVRWHVDVDAKSAWVGQLVLRKLKWKCVEIDTWRGRRWIVMEMMNWKVEDEKGGQSHLGDCTQIVWLRCFQRSGDGDLSRFLTRFQTDKPWQAPEEKQTQFFMSSLGKSAQNHASRRALKMFKVTDYSPQITSPDWNELQATFLPRFPPFLSNDLANVALFMSHPKNSPTLHLESVNYWDLNNINFSSSAPFSLHFIFA